MSSAQSHDDLWLPVVGGGWLRVAGGAPLASEVAWVCPGWLGQGPSAGSARPRGDPEPAFHIAWDGEGRPVVAKPGDPSKRMRFQSVQDAVLPVINMALRAMLQADPRCVMLHAAALVAPDGRAVTLVGRTHAGKSTLTLVLAAAGWHILGDDVVAAAPGADGVLRVVGLGLAPKVRRPIPSRVAERAGAWAEARRVATVAEVDYLHPAKGELATLGESAPLGALLHLQRRLPSETPHAELHPSGPSETVRALANNLFAPDLGGQLRLRRILDLAGAAPGWTLSFDDSAAAADRLADTFAAGRTTG